MGALRVHEAQLQCYICNKVLSEKYYSVDIRQDDEIYHLFTKNTTVCCNTEQQIPLQFDRQDIDGLEAFIKELVRWLGSGKVPLQALNICHVNAMIPQ